MEHQVSNVGPTPLTVYAVGGDSHVVPPGAIWIGQLWKIRSSLDGRVHYAVEPVEK